MIENIKAHSEIYGLGMISIGWITQHYAQVHNWLSIVLLCITIVGACLTSLFTLLKIIKFFKNNSGL
jgi:hypothetical protein